MKIEWWSRCIWFYVPRIRASCSLCTLMVGLVYKWTAIQIKILPSSGLQAGLKVSSRSQAWVMNFQHMAVVGCCEMGSWNIEFHTIVVRSLQKWRKIGACRWSSSVMRRGSEATSTMITGNECLTIEGSGGGRGWASWSSALSTGTTWLKSGNNDVSDSSMGAAASWHDTSKGSPRIMASSHNKGPILSEQSQDEVAALEYSISSMASSKKVEGTWKVKKGEQSRLPADIVIADREI